MRAQSERESLFIRKYINRCRFFLTILTIIKKARKLKGIIGITMLDKGVERLGFDVITPVNPFYRFFKKVSHVPILYLTSKPVSLRHLPNSSYLFISKEKLQKTYQKKD